MAEAQEYTITQVAELLNVSKQTVRRRIESGEYPARKVKDITGVEAWMIPADIITDAIMTKEVLEVKRPVSIPELKSALVEAFNEALENRVTPLEEEIRNLRGQIAELTLSKEDIDELKAEIHSINENQLDRETLIELLKKKSFWDRFKK